MLTITNIVTLGCVVTLYVSITGLFPNIMLPSLSLGKAWSNSDAYKRCKQFDIAKIVYTVVIVAYRWRAVCSQLLCASMEVWSYRKTTS